MSNNNDANAEANDNNNEVQGRENLENQPPQQLQHHNHNNIQQLPQPAHGHPLDHDPLNNQNNPPEWAAFPDLLRVQVSLLFTISSRFEAIRRYMYYVHC